MRSAAIAAVALAAVLATAAAAQDPPDELSIDAPTPKAPAEVAHPAPTAAPAAAAPAATTDAKTPRAAAPISRPRIASAPAAAAPAPVAVARALPAAELAAFVDGYVAQAMRREHIAGVTVSIVQNGQVVLKKGYGFASLAPPRPVDPDRTLFRLGPASQALTWIAVMKQVEAGRIRLDQPVNLYLPERVQVHDNGYDQPVRMLDLMSHSAGFEVRGFGEGVEKDRDYVRPLALYLRRERPRRVRPPGTVATTSTYGVALAGEAVAWVEGKLFERVVEEQILLPLGLRHTTFREARPVKAGLPAPMPPALAEDAADAFRWRGGAFQREPAEFAGQVAPAGSAASTAGDMARVMLALLGGGQLDGVALYGPQTARAFRTPILAVPEGVNGWAHGFAVETLPGGRRGFGAGGAGLSAAAHLVTAPDLDLGVFVAANSLSGERLTQDLPAAVIRQFYGPAAPFPPTPSAAAEAGLYDGHYLSTQRAYRGLQGFVGRILGAVEVSTTRDGRLLTRALPHHERSWIAEPGAGRFVGEDGDSRLAFSLEDGRATAFVKSDGAARYERVGYWSSPKALGLFAGLAAAASAASLVGAALRNRNERRETQIQSRAGLVQNIQAGLWLTAMALFAAWALRSLESSRLVFGWPSSLVVTASACALVAGALTITTMVALPSVWQGGRRVDSWSGWRKLGYSTTVAIYAVFAWLLARGGALSPWSG
jgi:CubicO group peptidase (beta-lactamase class C family)